MREALIAVVSALGLGGAGAAITLVTCYARTAPEFPPPESGQPNP